MRKRAANAIERELEWREQQRRFENGGQSVLEFCRSEGLGASTFYQRRVRLKQRDQARAPVKMLGGEVGAEFIDAGAVVAARPGRRALCKEPPLATEVGQHFEVHLELGNGVVLHLVRS